MEMPDLLRDLMSRAAAARQENRLDEARLDWMEAVRLCREAGSDPALAAALTGLGQIERNLGDSGAAVQCYEEAANLHRALGDSQRLAHSLRHLADILREAGAREPSRLHYEEALRLYQNDARTAPLDLANTLRGIALLHEKCAEFENARETWARARDLYAACQVEAGVRESSRRLSHLTL